MILSPTYKKTVQLFIMHRLRASCWSYAVCIWLKQVLFVTCIKQYKKNKNTQCPHKIQGPFIYDTSFNWVTYKFQLLDLCGSIISVSSMWASMVKEHTLSCHRQHLSDSICRQCSSRSVSDAVNLIWELHWWLYADNNVTCVQNSWHCSSQIRICRDVQVDLEPHCLHQIWHIT